MNYNFPKTGIYKYVARYLHSRDDLAGKKALDCPAGDGRTSYLLNKKGASVVSGDLFPEFFKLNDLKCEEVDISNGLPFPDETFDFAVCQEGIEHFPNQLFVLQEFARVLKRNGELLITAPSISHLRAKLSHVFVESEYYKRSAPSELDGVWFSKKNANQLYFGHVFLINIQKLRTLSVFSGFEISRVFRTEIGITSILLFPIFYPFVVLLNLAPFIFYSKKLKHIPKSQRKRVMWEQFFLNLSFHTLTSKYTMILFKKTRNSAETIEHLKQLTRS